MPAPKPGAGDDGGVFTVEALLAALLVLSAVACLGSASAQPQRAANDLGLLASDLLHVLEYRGNAPGHPDLASALASPDAWAERSEDLARDMRSMMPPGVRCFLSTPYGDLGDLPPGSAQTALLPFEAFRRDTGTAIPCRLILWR